MDNALSLQSENLTTSPLLRLPQELLDTILSYLIVSNKPRRPTAWNSCSPPIRKVCRKLRSDTGKILFTRDFEYWDTKRRPLGSWVREIAGEHKRHITKLRNGRIFTEDLDEARWKATQMDREFGLKKGTGWILMYEGRRQCWVNWSGEREEFNYGRSWGKTYVTSALCI